jgi:hypothetical protein
MFELVCWFRCVGAEPLLSLVSRNSRARQLFRKTKRRFGGPRGRVHPDAVTSLSYHRRHPPVTT